MSLRPPHDDDKQPADFSRIGLFVFLGLVLGAAAGGFTWYSPVPGALAGALIGLALALMIDRRKRGR